MVSSNQLGQIIKEARRKAGLTQDDLSDKAGLAYSTLAKIEQGAIKSPSFFTVYAISEGLGLELGELLGTDKPGSNKAALGAKNGSKNKIKFVYSDVNGVLVRFYHKAFATISQETGCNLGLVESTIWHYNDAANDGDMTLDEFNKAVAKHLDVKSIDWKAHYMAAVKPIDEIQRCLEDIQGKVGVGLLTNAMPGFVDELTRKKMLPNMKFDTVVDSSVDKLIKPSPAIYELAEKRAGYSGGEILFVDDSRANLIAAEKFNWQVMWFDDYDPSISVQHLREVVGSL